MPKYCKVTLQIFFKELSFFTRQKLKYQLQKSKLDLLIWCFKEIRNTWFYTYQSKLFVVICKLFPIKFQINNPHNFLTFQQLSSLCISILLTEFQVQFWTGSITSNKDVTMKVNYIIPKGSQYLLSSTFSCLGRKWDVIRLGSWSLKNEATTLAYFV